MQRLEVSVAVRLICMSLGFKRLSTEGCKGRVVDLENNGKGLLRLEMTLPAVIILFFSYNDPHVARHLLYGRIDARPPGIRFRCGGQNMATNLDSGLCIVFSGISVGTFLVGRS